MNKREVILIILILFFLYTRRTNKGDGTSEVMALVSSYKSPQGEVFFAFQINDTWYQVNASKSEEMEVGNFNIKSKPTATGGYMLRIELNGNVSEYFANKEGEQI
jgi:hypothetical protein